MGREGHPCRVEAAGWDEREGVVEAEAFGELLRYTVAGDLGGLLLGFVLDALDFQPRAVGQSLVRIAANLCWVPPLVGWFRERRG